MALTAKTTQQFVPVKEVREGIVVLRDGSLRMVLMASSLNFALKSADEQNAIIMQFQNFLNSLEFPVEFSIQSRRLDIRPYVAMLEGRMAEQVNELIKIQTREYIEFVKNFTDSTEIMTKNFFIVIPYSTSIIKTKKTPIETLLSFGGSKEEGSKKSTSKEKEIEDFEEKRSQIEQRAGVVEQGLARSGVRVVQLGTEEIIELLYKTFNPGELEKPVAINQ